MYLLPTYNEAFGFAILEAMAYGIPVIATNQFAIPEMIEHEKSGLLVDISKYDTAKLFRGYVVDKIPAAFQSDVNDQLFGYLMKLLESKELRLEIGEHGRNRVRVVFGFKARNEAMQAIYYR